MSNETPVAVPSISVVIPVYNTAAYLAETISSVLSQIRPVQEIIVVDDGSTDDSLFIARSFGEPVRCIAKSHTGVGATRNAGIREAGGELLAFLDADDLWRPHATDDLLSALQAQPDLDGVVGQTVEFLSPEIPREKSLRFKVRTQPQAAALPGAMLIRRAVFLTAGFFREDLGAGEFVDWYARAQEAGIRFSNLPVVTVGRRIHLRNTSHFSPARAHDYLTVVRDRLKRQRQG